MLKQLLADLGLIYSGPATPAPAGKDKSPDKSRTKAEPLPDLRYTPSGVPLLQSDKDDGLEADVYKKGAGQRPDRFTNYDLSEVRSRGLDETKARKLKPYWASGLSATEGARALSGERGFRKRTLESYWAAFNAAAAKTPSPTEK